MPKVVWTRTPDIQNQCPCFLLVPVDCVRAVSETRYNSRSKGTQGNMPLPTTSASLLYQSLANAIDTAQGTIVLDLNPGYWLTRLGQDILWIIPDLCEAEIQFSYGGGVLNSASVSFDPPVHVEVRGNLGGALISEVTYNRFGNVLTVRMVPTDPNNPMSDTIKTEVLRTLSYDRTPKSLFLGTPFIGLKSAAPSNDNFQPASGPASLVSRVHFTPDAGVPALAVTFKDHATIKFSDSTIGGSQFTNFVTVRSGSGFQFDDIDYSVDERTLSGSLSSFSAIVERGLFSTSNLLLQLQPSASIKFNQVGFSKDATGAVTVDATFGTFQASLTAGSQISFAPQGAGGATFLSFDNGSQVTVVGFAISIHDGGATTVQIGGGSSLQLNVHQGRIGFGANDFFTLSVGQLNGIFSGAWTTNANPNATLQISLLDFSGVAGQATFNDATTLAFQDAAIKSVNLVFDSNAATPRLTGTLSTFRFTILENSLIGIPGGFEITAAAGGLFSIATPLELKASASSPVGQYTLNLPFKRILNAANASFSLNAGQANLSIQSKEDGTIVGTNCDIQGEASIVGGNLTVSPLVHISAITFTKAPGGDFTASGRLQATVPSGQQFSIATPFIKGLPDHDNFRGFPLTLNLSLSQPLAIPTTAFTAVNSSVTLDPINVTPTLGLNIPNGLGEHEDSDDQNSADGHHGPGEDQNLQEAITDTVSAARVHLYLLADSYQFQAQVTVAINSNQLDVNISHIQCNRDIDFRRDGGDLGPIGAVIGFAFGGLVPGIVGYVAGESLNQSIDHWIAAGIANYLLGLRFSWHGQL
jgi:hypothetical protein